jgi:hypothetical protein
LVNPSQETSPDSQGKATGGTSRFSRFGFGSQLLQKTVGLVLNPRPGKQVLLVPLYSNFYSIFFQLCQFEGTYVVLYEG